MRLSQFIYRPLLSRLVVGGVVISVLLGGLTFYYEMERVDDLFVGFALEEARRFVAEVPDIGRPLAPDSRTAIERGLQALVSHEAANAHGDYAIAEIYDANRNYVAEAAEAGVEPIERVVDRHRHAFPKGADYDYEKMVIDGATYIQVITALRDGQGGLQGYLEGVFRIWPATIAQVRHDTLRTSAMVIWAVLLTTLLLYPVVLRLNRSVLRQSRELLDANLAILKVLGGAIAKRDSDTSHHNYRVALFAVRLAEEAGLPEAQMRELIKGAFVHDVGKIAISDRILLKPGRLDAAEFEEMKTHVRHGVDIVRESHWLADAADVVRFHHEKYDGSGYLEGRKGDAIPLNARVFAIADVFDALTSKRPYKEAMSADHALQIMASGRGSHFDPQLFDLFMSIAGSMHAAHVGLPEDALAKELGLVTDAYFAGAVTG